MEGETKEAGNLRKGHESELGNQDLYLPGPVPKIPGRFYYYFGKPIETSGKEQELRDKEKAQELYLQVKSQLCPASLPFLRLRHLSSLHLYETGGGVTSCLFQSIQTPTTRYSMHRWCHGGGVNFHLRLEVPQLLLRNARLLVDVNVKVKDLEGEDVLKSEFCADIFDNVRLGYHIDEEHPVKAKNGVNNNHQTLLLECYADRCYVFGDMICLTLRFCSVSEKNGIDTHRRFMCFTT
ncbi:Uncharacterized protein Rs2_15015 [Raphanus sativus]|nr:Uncharacterized protein Rs2_15015 [Raphanus sativus]